MTTTDAVKAKPRQTCTDHCSDCGQHFHGLGAFDAHLKRMNKQQFGLAVNCPQNRWDVRSYQLEHLDGPEADLEPWTETGLCALSYPSQEGVTIWRLPLTEWAKARMAEQGGKADSGLPVSRRAPEGVGAGER